MRIVRYLCLAAIATVMAAPAAQAAPSAFDLTGPRLDVAITHGGVTLPLAWVPNLAEGDRVSITLDLPPGQSERYLVVAAFLRGAIDRPPRDWFHTTRSWKAKEGTLSLIVPKGAQQLALLLVPDAGSDGTAVIGAVRKQPGAFVRAVQELNQASLDRARLDTFLRAMQAAERDDPAGVTAASQALTRSLSIKLKAECLVQPVELQAACLTEDRETLLLADTHSSALADTIVGTPTDLALQLSATPQAGYGVYSSYIGVVRDLFRLFGAFQSTELQFVPALASMSGDRVALLLNTPLSFGKPTSVMVVALPGIEAAKPPPLRRSDPDAAACARVGQVLPVEGAPLIYATRYARNMALRFTGADGQRAEVPVHADARAGGFVIDRALPPIAGVGVTATLHGDWGFAPFDGPAFTLSNPQANGWRAADRASLVVGRADPLPLTGGAAGCVAQVEMLRSNGAATAVPWTRSGDDGIRVTLPLEKAAPGPVSLRITGAAGAPPATVTLNAYREAPALDTLTYHAGDAEAVLSGARLDQVRRVTLGGATFRPDGLSRADGQDRLTLIATDPGALVAGKVATADIALTGDRHASLAVTVAPPRATPVLIGITPHLPEEAGALPITLQPDGLFAQDAVLTFAFRPGDATLTGRETIEIATADGHPVAQIGAGKGYDLQDARTGVVTVAPGTVPGATGALQFRVVGAEGASRWAALGTLVRLPVIRAIGCTPGGGCTLSGDRLYRIAAIATDAGFTAAQAVPDGFTGTELKLPDDAKGTLYLRLRDAPGAVGSVRMP